MELTKEQRIQALQRLHDIAAKNASHEDREIRDIAVYTWNHTSKELEKLTE